MSGSTAEVQALADALLELLGARIRSGQVVIHYADGVVQKCEVNTIYRPAKLPPLRRGLDTKEQPSEG